MGLCFGDDDSILGWIRRWLNRNSSDYIDYNHCRFAFHDSLDLTGHKLMATLRDERKGTIMIRSLAGAIFVFAALATFGMLL